MDNKYIYKYYPYVISEKTLLRPLLTNLKSSSGVIIRKYNNGYVPYSSPYTKDITNNKLNNTGAIDIEQLELFKRTIEEILNNNISIIFVDIPEYLNDRTNSKYINTNQEVLRELANKYNIRFLEYNNAMVSYINFDQSYFSDTAHLNDRGAQAFSKRLSADLKTYLETSKFLSK
jgi:lysophospholipase L1-like esterase